MMGEQQGPQEGRYMKGPKRWPLVNTLNNRSSNFTTDARLVNAYAEKDRATGQYHVEKRGGFALTPDITVPAGVGQGVYTAPYFVTGTNPPFTPAGYLAQTIIVANYQAFSLISYVPSGVIASPLTLLGSVNVNPSPGAPRKMQFISINVNAGTPPLILFGSGATAEGSQTGVALPAAYYLTTGQTLLSLLTPGTNGFPYLTVPGFVFLDGYTYVMDIGGSIWQTTTQNQVTNWSPNFITAATDSDLAVQLARQSIYIVAIKQWTTQFYYDAGNQTGSSLSPVPGALFNIGCISSDTFAELDGVLFWATQSKEGSHHIAMVRDMQLEIISSSGVERQLDLSSTGSFYALAYQHSGHKFYVITNTVTNVTMVYDIGEKLWYLWTDYKGDFYPVCSRTIAPDGGEWHQMFASGDVYEMDGDYVYPNDSGNVVPVDIYTPNFDDGVDRVKYLSQMRFTADQTPGSRLYSRFSDNDYQSWNNFRMIDLSKQRPIINDEGSFYRRAYHFRHFANTGLRISSVELQMDVGVL